MGDASGADGAAPQGVAVLDTSLYRDVLREQVSQESQRRPGDVPVVELRLDSGKALDLCHIVHLADSWLAVQYFRDAESCDDMDLAFLPYGLVTLVTLSLHDPGSRRIGFKLSGGPPSPGTERT